MSGPESHGPLAQDKRGCTDCWCLGVLAAAWVLFFIVTFAGIEDGNPAKLYRPRDYRGAYCGVGEQWNGGPNLEGKDKRGFMMNVSASTDVIAKQLLCSSASQDYLLGALNATELDDYLCACCLAPCASCRGSVDHGGDLTSGNLAGAISARMGDLTNTENAVSLFSPSGANGDYFIKMWEEAAKYFVPTCLPGCGTDYVSLGALANASADFRNYTYAPSADSPLKASWKKLMETGPAVIKGAIADSFTFKAFPEAICPYPASHCVPFPGVKFSELANGYCTFEMAGEVVNAVGGAAAGLLQDMGGESLASSSAESFGRMLGDFETSIDTFIVVAIAAFVIGLVFMVCLRFGIGVCIWIAILLVLLGLLLGGGVTYVRSIQCKDAGLLESGERAAVAVTISGTSAVKGAATGDQGPSEVMTGDGADYRGVQTRTVSGKTCQAWDQVTPHNHSYTAANYPNASLTGNFCRNPYRESDRIKASTIWCYTTDMETRWEECAPIGLVEWECPGGHAVQSKSMRDTLKILSYIIWGSAGVWVLTVMCMRSRIRLAIALNKVGATFIMHTPRILLVPMVQATTGILWVLLWLLSASFLLSQVPDSYTPKGHYATYAEAHGVDGDGMFDNGTPGACTDKWPTGFVWKDDECEDGKCWRCAPPRFVINERFAYSFFIYLWNNAFLIAIGQCIIAGAVATWFFTPNVRKGRDPAIKTATWHVFRFHAGSLALGSFIIAVVEFVRYVMMYLEKQAQAQKNQVMVLVFRALQCCIWCFEKCLKFLSKNAYIQIAINGTNFCNSARKAFEIITANVLRFGTVALLGGLVHYIGLIFVMASTIASGYFLLKEMHPDISPVMPLFIYAALAYVVGKLYMNVFGLAVDTCLQCVILAEDKGLGADVVPNGLRAVLEPRKADS